MLRELLVCGCRLPPVLFGLNRLAAVHPHVVGRRERPLVVIVLGLGVASLRPRVTVSTVAPIAVSSSTVLSLISWWLISRLIGSVPILGVHTRAAWS